MLVFIVRFARELGCLLVGLIGNELTSLILDRYAIRGGNARMVEGDGHGRF